MPSDEKWNGRLEGADFPPSVVILRRGWGCFPLDASTSEGWGGWFLASIADLAQLDRREVCMLAT